MSKRFWIIIVAIVVIFFGFLFLSKGKDKQGASGANTQPTNHVKGNAQSKVKLVEYGDFQCPICGLYYPVVTQVVDKYQSDISFQFRHLPLSQAHPNAFAAARAAEAAGKQGKFWEMYDLLFRNQDVWSRSSAVQEQFVTFASQLGLNVNQFRKDFVSDSVNGAINADINAYKATKQASLATPTFFLDGKKIELKQLTDQNNAPQAEKFSQLIDAELQKQNQQQNQ